MDSQATTKTPKSPPKDAAVPDLVASVSKVQLDDEHDILPENNSHSQPTRTLVIYPRSHALKLYKSPLVKPPNGMPALKDWFGYVTQRGTPVPHADASRKLGK